VVSGERSQTVLKRINALIKDTLRTPFEGLGKPKPLKADLSGYWSRRVDSEHRQVYEVTETDIVIIACRFHYEE